MKPIIPNVKKRIDHQGFFLIPAALKVMLPFSLNELQPELHRLFHFETTLSPDAEVCFTSDAQIKPEGYKILVSPDKIEIEYRDYSGAFYALESLLQLRNSKKNAIPCLEIEDYPDMVFRGFMMDISRDKVPSVDTVKSIIDKMAFLKMNHLELYIEGFSFEYPSFPEVALGETPISIAEFKELALYANTKAIDLCGNQNGFGHMTAWLKRPQYHHLAECPHGFKQWGYPFPASTLNPLDPRSVELVKTMIGDMIPHSLSPYFNINCDEPFELSLGKSKKACREKGIGQVYVDYVKQLVDFVNEHGKTALVWGDVLIHHPEVLPQLPEKMVFLDWGYDFDYPFDPHTELLRDLKVKFVTCPGTSSWNSFSGRKKDMLESTNHAADAVKKNGGLGLLMTDWGDFGHLQYLPFSFPGLIWAGLTTWDNAKKEEQSILDVMNQWFKNPELASAIWELSGYSSLENKYVPNGTLAFSPIMFSDPSAKHPVFLKRYILKKALKSMVLSEEAYIKIHDLLQNVQKQLENVKTKQPEDGLVKSEIDQTIRMIQMGIDVNRYINQGFGTDSKEVKKALIKTLFEISSEHERLWLSRNKSGGLVRSLSRLESLKSILQTL